jgi:DNA topoisomerase-1
MEPVENIRHARKNVSVAVTQVAARLGNTPAVCRKCYIHPAIVESYIDGELARTLRKRVDHEIAEEDLADGEARVLRFLERRLAKAAKDPRGARAA